MTALVLYGAAAMFILRLLLLRRLWTVPLKHGKDYFLAQRVAPDFYDGAGAPLLRRYHASLFLPLAADLPVVLWLAVTHRFTMLSLEQIFAYFVSVVTYNVMLVHFSYRVMAMIENPEDHPPRRVQLSVQPRRLRDHTKLGVELVIAGALALDAILLWRSYMLSAGAAGVGDLPKFRGAVVFAMWIIYWQLGALLLKGVIVRWRMLLPVNRAEDWRRWREAWLNANLKTLDAIRVFTAVVLPWVSAWIMFRQVWSRPAVILLASGSLLILAAYCVYLQRERRGLLKLQKELKPVEMVKEFPRMPVPDGRFVAGGFIYFNRDNPRLLVRSHQGVAINMSNPAIYAWVAYFAGLLALMTWMAK